MPNIVNNMNDKTSHSGYEILTYQALRLKDLIKEIVQCCDDRKFYESNRFQLPAAELKCLLLFIGERYLTSKVIACRLDVAKSRVTKIIKGLMDKGMVEMVNDPKDSRMKLLSFTEQGRKMSEQVELFHNEMHRQILTHMDENERMDVLSKLERLRSSMEAVKGKMTMETAGLYPTAGLKK